MAGEEKKIRRGGGSVGNSKEEPAKRLRKENSLYWQRLSFPLRETIGGRGRRRGGDPRREMGKRGTETRERGDAAAERGVEKNAEESDMVLRSGYVEAAKTREGLAQLKRMETRQKGKGKKNGGSIISNHKHRGGKRKMDKSRE